MKKQKGFTLVETLLYIALFTIIIGGGIVAVYQIIQSTEASYSHVILQEEANFLFRKIDWALTGLDGPTSIITPTNYSDTTLTVNKDSAQVKFYLDNGNLTVQRDSGTIVPLNSSNITASSTPSTHLFERIITPGKPDAITTNFTLTTEQNSWPATQTFSFTKYLRR